MFSLFFAFVVFSFAGALLVVSVLLYGIYENRVTKFKYYVGLYSSIVSALLFVLYLTDIIIGPEKYVFISQEFHDEENMAGIPLIFTFVFLYCTIASTVQWAKLKNKLPVKI